MEKRGWHISKQFDRAQALHDAPTAWWEGPYWFFRVFGAIVLFVASVAAIVYGVFL